MRVLIVDDSALIRVLISEYVTYAGHEVVGEASNGLEAVKKFKQLAPDFVIIDRTMPKMSGIKAIQEIKRLNSSARIIMCSASNEIEAKSEAVRVGVFDYISKPFDKDRLLSAFEMIAID